MPPKKKKQKKQRSRKPKDSQGSLADPAPTPAPAPEQSQPGEHGPDNKNEADEVVSPGRASVTHSCLEPLLFLSSRLIVFEFHYLPRTDISPLLRSLTISPKRATVALKQCSEWNLLTRKLTAALFLPLAKGLAPSISRVSVGKTHSLGTTQTYNMPRITEELGGGESRSVQGEPMMHYSSL